MTDRSSPLSAASGGLGRRALLRAAAAGALAPCMAQASDVDHLAFEVRRHGSLIGRHEVRFERDGALLSAHIDCSLRVVFGPITVFRYRHQGIERWRNGRFVSLETWSDNNGEAFSVAARHVGDSIEIRTASGRIMRAPAAALPLTHWNLACMNAPLFNPQDGQMLNEQARFEGRDKVALADGREVTAMRYAMSGAAPIEDWYDATQSWAALRARVKDGSVLEYRRV